jgi:folate-binding protein YgfZ
MDFLKIMMDGVSAEQRLVLTGLGVLRVGGSDARAFLQGQLSNDLLHLTPDHPLLAALNTAQGRVIAILRLLQRPDGIFVILPAGLVAKVIATLGRYVMRSKVTLKDESASITVIGRLAPKVRELSIAAHADMNGDSTLPVAAATANERWRLAGIEAGEPQVYPETSEAFVAQMLNLDLVDGISFSKGCYTGQEIIARTQHRGRIKRRMLRYRVHNAPPIERGQQVRLDGGRAGRIVDFAVRRPGETEILAVVPLEISERESAADTSSQLNVERLPLPYDIPDLR